MKIKSFQGISFWVFSEPHTHTHNNNDHHSFRNIRCPQDKISVQISPERVCEKKKKKKKKDNGRNGATVSFGEMKYALFSWERGKGDFDGWHFW